MALCSLPMQPRLLVRGQHMGLSIPAMDSALLERVTQALATSQARIPMVIPPCRPRLFPPCRGPSDLEANTTCRNRSSKAVFLVRPQLNNNSTSIQARTWVLAPTSITRPQPCPAWAVAGPLLLFTPLVGQENLRWHVLPHTATTGGRVAP